MGVLILVRIMLTLTFLILAAGGPYAILLLRRFIRRYTVAHEELKIRVAAQETAQAELALRMAALEHRAGMPAPESNNAGEP